MTYPGTAADVAAQVIKSHSTPVMGRNAHVIFREFQEVFGSRHPAASHKESIVFTVTTRLAQVTSVCSKIAEAVAAMLSAGADHWHQDGRTTAPHCSPTLLVPSGTLDL